MPHQPEPWTTVDNSWETTTIYDANGRVVAVCPIDPNVTKENQDECEAEKNANAERIVACVEACREQKSPQDLRRAAQRLLQKMDMIHADERYVSIFSIAAIHGFTYKGPQCVEELDDLRKALEGLPAVEETNVERLREMIRDRNKTLKKVQRLLPPCSLVKVIQDQVKEKL